MSTPVNTGGPAFPFVQWRSPDGMYSVQQDAGMTLRDWFAGQALPQVMAIYAVANGHMIGTDHFPRNCAAHAYTMADAMITEREKGGAL